MTTVQQPKRWTNKLRSATTRRFITALTTARQRSLSWARRIHSTPPPQPISLRAILIPTSHLRPRLKSNGDKASPCFRPFWIGNLSDRNFPIRTVL
jgi:hypothetical protein